MHEHYKIWPDGTRQKVGETVVTRESLWDPATRGRALSLIEHEDSIDRQTNLPYAEALKAQPFMVDEHINHAAATLDRHKREAEQTAKGRGEKAPVGWNDGVQYVVRPATPEEIQAHEAKRAQQPAQELAQKPADRKD